MKNVSFVKFTSYGNNFVIVDEIRTPVLDEYEKSDFAYQATNICFGVGSDNFLVIQPCEPEVLKGINRARQYWSKLPDATGVDYIFRMFEPDGKEAFSCGNGLMCIAEYLYRQYGAESARIMTEIPTTRPNVVSIGTLQENRRNWANMGHPHKISQDLVHPSVTVPFDDIIDAIEEMEISFRAHDLSPFSDETSLKLTGYLVFTGEPHFVIFTETGFSRDNLGKIVFISPNQDIPATKMAEKRYNYGTWFVDQIGTYFNRKCAHLFPEGLNINFARIAYNGSEEVLEYRCYERGINRETLACGTGALAVSYVAKRLKLISTKQINVWPYRCRWHLPEAQIEVEEGQDGWLLRGNPIMLFEGEFKLDHPRTLRDVPFIAGGAIAGQIMQKTENAIYQTQNLSHQTSIERNAQMKC